MKKIIQLTLFILISVISSSLVNAQAIPDDSLYLGQTPPGNTPKIFNLPLTNGLRPVERIAISSDGKEIYYGLLDTYPPNIQKTKCLKYMDNRWQGPFDIFAGHASPRLSTNDSTMYIQTNINDLSTTYRSTKTNSGWSSPIKFINTSKQTHYFQTTSLNNSYLSSNLPATPTQRDICKLVIDGSDTLIQGLGLPINTTADENDLFVADDESYLLFSRNSSPGGDIFLSFKKENGGWTNPKKFGGPINKPGNNWEYGMFVSKDGKYLFYTSGGTTMNSYYTYWIKIVNIIDSLRHTNFIPYLNKKISSQSAQVGQLFSFTISDSTFIDDDENNTLIYSATLSDGNPLPTWLMFDAVARTFTGTPTDAVNTNIKVTVKDNANTNVSCTFAINAITTGVEEEKKDILKSINLLQNYPNPFNPVTVISWQLPLSSYVVIKVFDLLGSEIATLVNENKNPGEYRVEFDGSSLSSGIYYYQLKCGSFVDTKKFILMK